MTDERLLELRRFYSGYGWDEFDRPVGSEVLELIEEIDRLRVEVEDFKRICVSAGIADDV